MNQLWPFKTDVRKHVVSPHTVIMPKDDSNIHKQEFDIDAVPAPVGRFLKYDMQVPFLHKNRKQAAALNCYFPDYDDTYGSRSAGLLSIKPRDAAASSKIFCWIQPPLQL
jgi:hypothetical protein